MADNKNILQGQVPGQQFYCRIKINGIECKSENIESLTIREWINEILPRLDLKIGNRGFFLETNPICDGDIIEVLISKNMDSNEILNASFIISDHSISVEADNKMIHLDISGYLNVKEMFVPIKTRSFKKKNSKEVLRVIANESGLKFKDPHNVIPTDKMTWYQINKTNYDFIPHVLLRSYVPNDTIMFFSNVNGEFVFTSLKSELFKQQSKIAKYSIENFNKNFLNDDDVKTLWYGSYDLMNYGSYFNRIIGYGSVYTYFDNNNGVEFLNQYNDAKDIKKSKITDYIFRNKNLNNKPVFNSTFGIFNNLNLYGKEYFESFERNYDLMSTNLSLSVLINVNSIENVKLCDKINLVLPSLFDNKISDPYSGLYIVSGITHFISRGGIYQKIVSLSRNGINKPFNRELNTLLS